MRCATAAEELTALADGALAADEAARVRDHIGECRACAGELRAIERVVELERRALQTPPAALSLGFETRLRQRLAEEDERGLRRPWAAWLWKPALIGAVATLVVLLAAAPLGGPSAVLVPLGIKKPPPKVANNPDLFKDYAIIERLEELENFDTVETTPLDEELPGASKDSA